MTPDHYATLGVAPTAPATVIRAAYLALMREYHPDRNPSPAAVERAQAVIAAFKVLGDFDRRSQYDWARRRAREAAEAEAAVRPRKVGTMSIALAAIGLAAAGALTLMPSAPSPVPPPARPPMVEQRQAPVAAARPAAPPTPKPKVAVAEAPPPRLPDPVRVAEIEPVRTVSKKAERLAPPTRIKPTQSAPSRQAAIAKPAPRVVLAAARPPARPLAARPTASALPPPARAATAATDLASLDQFVMNFYGQSWRFGDAPKRAVLEQTRASFVARRGACAAEACKRAATLKLMRDVSAIVETGQTKSR